MTQRRTMPWRSESNPSPVQGVPRVQTSCSHTCLLVCTKTGQTCILVQICQSAVPDQDNVVVNRSNNRLRSISLM